MTPETIAALLNMGSAGAVIAVVIIFLKSNEKRDKDWIEANRKRDEEWRAFFTAINGGNEKDIADMRITAQRIMDVLEKLLSSYNAHDTRAQAVQDVLDELKVEVARIGTTRSRRKTTGPN